MKSIRRTAALLVTLAVSVPVLALAQTSPVTLETAAPKPTNLDFEDGPPSAVPAGWSATTATTGYLAETTTDSPRSGARAAAMHTENAKGGFGILMQSVDATRYRNHRVRLRASLRADGKGARAQFWVRVDRTGSRMGFFENMGGSPVVDATWKDIEIVADVDDDATSLNFGLLMQGEGTTAIDAVAIEDVGALVAVKEPPRPITDRGLQNLEAFTRLLGYVRHFHPSDEAAATAWGPFAIEGVRRVESATSPKELADRLTTIFNPVALSVRVWPTSAKPHGAGAPQSVPSGDLSVIEWRHKGFGDGDNKNGGIYHSERERAAFANGAIPSGFHDPRTPLVADLPGGVTVSVPIALFADATGTLPHAAKPAAPSAETSLVKYTGDDRATRIADVALAWNVFEHFYPYFDVEKVDWSAQLPLSLRAAATATGEEAFTDTMRALVAALHDGHGGVQGPSPSKAAAVPVLWAWAENHLVVTFVGPDAPAEVKPGEVVMTIDGRPTADVIAEAEKLVSSATPQWARFRVMRDMRTGPPASKLVLGLRAPDGSSKTVTLERTKTAMSLAESRPEKIADVAPGVVYVDISRINDADFTDALPKLEAARGIVFDLRGYPNNVSPMPLTHLIDSQVASARWNIPLISDPDWKGTPGWATDGRWTLDSAAPRLKAKIAFVTDSRAISYAESWMGIVEAYHLGAIVGETTAGTNGNVNPVTLPGGYTMWWTGMKVLKHDGSRHHGVGIAPTVPAPRTIKGIAAGRDEPLDRAIAVVGGESKAG